MNGDFMNQSSHNTLLLGPEFKSLPPSSWGTTAEQFLQTRPRVSAFQTPLLTLDRRALSHNVTRMVRWVGDRGMALAPHGKTSMSPMLWGELLNAGAWGITLATAWQVQLARSFGVERIMLANLLVDPVALRWIAAELSDPAFEVSCWVDSVESVRAMQATLREFVLERPLPVIVDLGAPGGRTGARSVAAALKVVAAVEDAPELSLAGVGGYEGALADDRSAAGLAAIVDYVDSLVNLCDSVEWGARTPIVTAGGSAFFDVVAERLARLVGRATVVLRSGAFQTHDDGFYSRISPLAGDDGFRSAMHGWARVLSRPEPSLAILDCGKRDFPYDGSLPVAQHVVGATPLESERALRGSQVLAFKDQHAYLRISEDADLPIGAVLRLGLSHPCTAYDKWRLVPVVGDASDPDPLIVALAHTWF